MIHAIIFLFNALRAVPIALKKIKVSWSQVERVGNPRPAAKARLALQSWQAKLPTLQVISDKTRSI
jgi:hypothetical protein